MIKGGHIPSQPTTRLFTIGLLLTMAVACGEDQEPEVAGFPELDRSGELQVCHQVGLDSQGPAEVVFGSIRAAVRGDDGALYILDRQALEIHRFDRDGLHMGSFGRDGEGPGEMSEPVTMEYADGAVKVWDFRLSRITTFSPEGEVLTVQPVDAMPMMAQFPEAWRLSSGNWIYTDYRPPEVDLEGIRGAEQVRGVANLVRWSPAESRWDHVMKAPGPESVLYALPNGVRGALPAPLAREPLWAPAGDNEFWYADSGSYSVIRLNIDGDTVGQIAASFVGEPATAEDRDAYLDMFQESPREVRQVVDDLAFPERHPALQGLRTATTGEVWVKPVLAQGEHWHVFSAEGEPLFQVELPDDRRLEFVQADTLVAIGTDPLGVQFVETFVLDQSGDGC